MIPKSFTLINRAYSVGSYVKGHADELKRNGDCDKETAKIRLDNSVDKECLEHTFYHELVHALLWASTKPKLSTNEDFVDSLGALLHQYEQTKKGEYKK